jgi:hypothetical protein
MVRLYHNQLCSEFNRLLHLHQLPQIVGGRSKDFSQVLNKADNAYVAADDIEVGSGNKIPLWLFGFVY